MEVPRAVWADGEPAVWEVLSGVLDGERRSVAWRMSSSATPWLRADGWISTKLSVRAGDRGPRGNTKRRLNNG
jgi:hypothetical protein